MPSQATAEKDSAAGITPAAPWRVKAMSVLPDYQLAVTFNDDTSGIADLSSATKAKDAGIYSALADPAIFEQATLSLGVITWPNGADLDPAWMYERLWEEKTWASPFSKWREKYGDTKQRGVDYLVAYYSGSDSGATARCGPELSIAISLIGTPRNSDIKTDLRNNDDHGMPSPLRTTPWRIWRSVK